MIELPLTIPKDLRIELSEMFPVSNCKELLQKMGECILSQFDAAYLAVSFQCEEISNEEIYIWVAREKNEITSRGLEKAWLASRASVEILSEMKTRLSPVSHSSFSWPFEQMNYKGEQILPADYSVLFPIHSGLTIRYSSSPKFFGNLMVLREEFPEFDEETVNLLIILPELLSGIVSMYLTECS